MSLGLATRTTLHTPADRARRIRHHPTDFAVQIENRGAGKRAELYIIPARPSAPPPPPAAEDIFAVERAEERRRMEGFVTSVIVGCAVVGALILALAWVLPGGSAWVAELPPVLMP